MAHKRQQPPWTCKQGHHVTLETAYHDKKRDQWRCKQCKKQKSQESQMRRYGHLEPARPIFDGRVYCTRCEQMLPTTEFTTRKRRTPGESYSAYCRPCMAEYKREWQDTNNSLRRAEYAAKRAAKGKPVGPSNRTMVLRSEWEEHVHEKKKQREAAEKAEAKARAIAGQYRLLVSLYPVGTRVFDPGCAFFHKNTGVVVGHHPATGCIQVNVDRDYASEPLWIFAGCVVAAEGDLFAEDVEGITA